MYPLHAKRKKTMEDVIMKFESVQDFCKYLDKGKTQIGFVEHSRLSTKSFTGTESWDEAQNLMQHGDIETYNEIRKIQTKYAKSIQTTQNVKRIKLSHAGFLPCVPAYLGGAEKCMFRKVTQPERKRVANVIYNASIDCSVGAESIRDASVRLMQAIRNIEAGGTRVNLYVCIFSRLRKRTQTTGALIKIKDSGQYMDVLKMVYPLTNPSMLRRHFLRFIETTKGISKKFVKGYGVPIKDASEITGRILNGASAKIASYYEIKGMNIDQITEKLTA